VDLNRIILEEMLRRASHAELIWTSGLVNTRSSSPDLTNTRGWMTACVHPAAHPDTPPARWVTT
jgi:hypothetical protein